MLSPRVIQFPYPSSSISKLMSTKPDTSDKGQKNAAQEKAPFSAKRLLVAGRAGQPNLFISTENTTGGSLEFSSSSESGESSFDCASLQTQAPNVQAKHTHGGAFAGP